MPSVSFLAKCPRCGREFTVTADLPEQPPFDISDPNSRVYKAMPGSLIVTCEDAKCQQLFMARITPTPPSNAGP